MRNPLTQKRVDLIEMMNEILDSWDGTAETAPQIIEELHGHVEELKTLHPAEDDFDRPSYSVRESELLLDIYRKEKLVWHVMKIKKNKLQEEMKGMNHKQKMVHQYLLPQHKPTFVNRGL